MNITINLTEEAIGQIVRRDLIVHRDDFMERIEKNKSGESYLHCISTDDKEDLEHMRKMLDSFNNVLEYYGGR